MPPHAVVVVGGGCLESTFIDQNNPKRQTADPHWGSPKLDLSAGVVECMVGGHISIDHAVFDRHIISIDFVFSKDKS